MSSCVRLTCIESVFCWRLLTSPHVIIISSHSQNSDLALEAEFLASLNHPHIIKLRGMAFDGTSGFENGPTGYFLIIDRLFETLDDRIKSWAKKSSPSSSRKSNRRFSKLSRSLSLSRSFSMGPMGKKDLSNSAPPPLLTQKSSSAIGDELMDERLSVGKSGLCLCL